MDADSFSPLTLPVVSTRKRPGGFGLLAIHRERQRKPRPKAKRPHKRKR